MNIFISWSGPRSRTVAESLGKFLTSLDKRIKPFLSTEIEKGSNWYQELDESLKDSKAAIICLTPENRDSPWIHFEAGAVEHRLHGNERSEGQSTVYTYLYPAGAKGLTGPLAQYQATMADKQDTWQMVASLFRVMGDENKSWVNRFDRSWAKLEQSISRLWLLPADVVDDLERMFDRKTFREPVHECTAQTWGDRFAGAWETHGRLQAALDSVTTLCRPYHRNLFRELVADVDGYAMDLSSLLLGQHWELDDDGTLKMPKGTKQACERRRNHINNLVSRLLDPVDVPILDESWRFRNEGEAEQRSLVHRKVRYIRNHREVFRDNETLQAWSESGWAFDRIAYYLTVIEAKRARKRLAYPPSFSECLEHELQEASPDPKQIRLSVEWCLQAALETSDAWLEDADETAGMRGLLGRVEQQTVDHSRGRSLVDALGERLQNATT
jgi:hypothetical protein